MRRHLQWPLLILVLTFAVPSLALADKTTERVLTAAGPGGNGINNGAPDAFRVVLNADQAQVDVYLNGKFSESIPLAGLDKLTIQGSKDDDSLTIDSSNGLISLPGGIHFNGGGGANRVVLTQSGSRYPAETYETFSVGACAGEGSDLLAEPGRAQKVSFQDVKSVFNTVRAASLTVQATVSESQIDYTQGVTAANGRVVVKDCTPIEFCGKTTLVIESHGKGNVVRLDNSSVPTALAGIAVQSTSAETTWLALQSREGVSECATIEPSGPRAGLITFTANGKKTAAKPKPDVVLPITPPAAAPPPGAVVWLDASTLKLADGAAVTQLDDRSGNGHHARPFNAKNPPMFKAKGQAGLGTIHFNEGDQGLVTVSNLGITGDTSRSVFVVMAKSAPQFSYDWRGSIRVDLGDGSPHGGFGINDGQSELALPYQGAGDILLYPRMNVFPEVYGVVHDSATHNSYGYINGALMRASVHQPINTADGPLQIGYRASDRASSVGDFAELLIYNLVLDDAARQQVENYLKAKWAIHAPQSGGDGRTPYVVFSSVSLLGLGGPPSDGNTFRIDGTRGNDRLEYSDGAIRGTMDQNNVTGKGPYRLGPIVIRGMSQAKPPEGKPAAFSFGNVMTLGSSLTYGDGVPGGYRDQLYTDLTKAGYPLNFVGSVAENASKLLTAAGQIHQEGHGGFETYRLDVNLDAWLSVSPDPDYVLLLCGTNDFGHHFKVEEAIKRLDTLVSHIANARPYARIIVCSECKRTDDAKANWGIENLYNPFIPAMVARHAACGQKVSFLDMHAAIGPSDLGPDKLHPNKTGYDKMGRAWSDVLRTFVNTGGTDEIKSLDGADADRKFDRKRRE